MSEVHDSDPYDPDQHAPGGDAGRHGPGHDSNRHDSDRHGPHPRDLPSPAESDCGDGALYLLGLLDERHSRMFAEHARSCALCSDDLAALAPAVEHLPTTVRQVPAPAHAKRQVMALVRSEAAQQAARPSASPTRQTSRFSWRARGAARGRFALRPALALAGTAVLAAGVAVGALSRPFGGGTPAGDSSARVVSADVTLAGASAALHQSGGHTWLTVADMPEPSSGHVYEVWLKRPGHAQPQPTDSLFAPTSSGTATAAVPDSSGANEVLVTQEPSGGTQRPTAPAVIVAHLS
jgi:Anti-sigma-K factor rskA